MLTDEQIQFAEKHIKLVYMIANKWKKRLHLVEWEELRSCASEGLLKAVKYYKPDKNYKFSTFAGRCMENEILMMLRKDKKHHGILSIYLNVKDTDKEESVQIFETIASPVNTFDETLFNLISEEVSKLPDNERIVFMESLAGFKNREIGAKLGISQSYISRINARATKRLKKRLGEEI